MVNPHSPGEFGLIEWIRQNERPVTGVGWTQLGIGDDCAILGVRASTDVLITTDMLMDGRHFRLDLDGAEAVGYKAMGVNLSDIAAMAGIPRAAVVAVALPRGMAVQVAQGLHSGMSTLANQFDVQVVGGDTNAWEGPLVIAITLLGETTARGAVRRSGARVGDAILVTGPLGGSLFAGRHLRPAPKIAEAIALNESASIHAMIDLSDGLSSDLSHILDESGGLGAILDAESIPIHIDAREMSLRDGVLPLDHALNDGEDFELCLTLSSSDADRLLSSLQPRAQLFRIGVITEGPGLQIRCADEIRQIEPHGFDHFRSA